MSNKFRSRLSKINIHLKAGSDNILTFKSNEDRPKSTTYYKGIYSTVNFFSKITDFDHVHIGGEHFSNALDMQLPRIQTSCISSASLIAAPELSATLCTLKLGADWRLGVLIAPIYRF